MKELTIKVAVECITPRQFKAQAQVGASSEWGKGGTAGIAVQDAVGRLWDALAAGQTQDAPSSNGSAPSSGASDSEGSPIVKEKAAYTCTSGKTLGSVCKVLESVGVAPDGMVTWAVEYLTGDRKGQKGKEKSCFLRRNPDVEKQLKLETLTDAPF